MSRAVFDLKMKLLISALIFSCLIYEDCCFQYNVNNMPCSSVRRLCSYRKVKKVPITTMVSETDTATPWKTNDRERQALAIGQRDLSFFQDPEALGSLLGGTGRAKMVWTCLRQGVDPCSTEGVDSSKTKLLLSTCFEGLPTISKQTIASCGTTKLLLDLKDGLQVKPSYNCNF